MLSHRWVFVIITLITGCTEPTTTITIDCGRGQAAEGDVTIQCGGDDNNNTEAPREEGAGGNGGSDASSAAGGGNSGYYYCWSYPDYPKGDSCVTDEDCPDPQSPCQYRTCGANGTCIGAFAKPGAALCGDPDLKCAGADCCGWLDVGL